MRHKILREACFEIKKQAVKVWKEIILYCFLLYGAANHW